MLNFRNALLAGAAIVALGAGSAQAQVQSLGFFGSVTGWYYLDAGNDKAALNLAAFNMNPPDDGWGGRLYGGYRFSQWDIAVGLQGSWLSKGKTFAGVIGGEKAETQAGDIELGYNFMAGPDVGLRFHGGLRVVRWEHSGTLTGAITHDAEYFGVGPRAGLDFAYRFGGSSVSLFANIAGAATFGRLRNELNTGGPKVTDTDGSTALNAEAQIGVQFDIAPMMGLAVGYRGEAWWNVGEKNAAAGAPPFTSSAKNDRLMHGPFVRLSYNIGAPVGAPVAAAVIPPAVMAKSYIVFFDFDRSNLTPTALGTIKQAADAAKAGKSARVNVTGHADKSGSDQYNMALSLRRANAVKDELVRQGIPAASIVVVGRGESAPLVPTADGVKEPQNRRVEIVLN